MLAHQKAFGPTVRAKAGAGIRVVAPSRQALSVFAGESRIGKKPIPIPKGVTVTLVGNDLKVKVRPPQPNVFRSMWVVEGCLPPCAGAARNA